MARKVEVQLIDDLDGSKAEESIKFALDGINYEIDLSKKNATKLPHDTDECCLPPYRLLNGTRGADVAAIWIEDRCVIGCAFGAVPDVVQARTHAAPLSGPAEDEPWSWRQIGVQE